MNEPRPEIEILDEWKGEAPQHWSESRIARVVMGSGVVVVALVVFVILGGTMRDANQPRPPTYPSVRVTPATTLATIEPPTLEADDPLEPLLISLVDQIPTLLAGSLASYDVKVCVSPTSAGVASDAVRVSLDGWLLRTAYYGDVSSPVSGGLAPAFPLEVRLGKGQCVTGYVTFPCEAPDGPHVIAYVSNRFEWTWYLS
jgi:hypothetical protein